jgi:hypothetical protein
VTVPSPLAVTKKDQNESEYFAGLFDSEKFSDVTLSVGATQISCHKIVLSGMRNQITFLHQRMFT